MSEIFCKHCGKKLFMVKPMSVWMHEEGATIVCGGDEMLNDRPSAEPVPEGVLAVGDEKGEEDGNKHGMGT